MISGYLYMFSWVFLGRVLTRFSKDQDVLDGQLPAVLYSVGRFRIRRLHPFDQGPCSFSS